MLYRLLDPFLVLMLGVGVATALVWFHRRVAPRVIACLTISYVLLYIGCMPVTMHYALGSLEWQFERSDSMPAEGQAIVVLGGYLVRPEDPSRMKLGEDTLQRCLTAMEVYRGGPDRPLVLSGGMVSRVKGTPTLATAMSDFIRQHGMESAEIILEGRSRNTYQNATETAKLLKRRNIDKIILITDAMHMLRAERCFRSQGIEVTPFGVQRRTDAFDLSIWSFLPTATAAQDMNRVAHEWLGLAWYSMQGFI